MTKHKLSSEFIHLGLGANAIPQPPFSGMEWYAAYGDQYNETDGEEQRLVSMYTFSESWTSWEVHPKGEEVVICTAGEITLHQEHADGSIDTVTLTPGEYAINPRGTWHTADVEGTATAIFITAGMGTDHRSR